MIMVAIPRISTIITIHSQLIGVPATLAAALALNEEKRSGIKMISGIANTARQQAATKAGSKMRHSPESRRFSVFAVP